MANAGPKLGDTESTLRDVFGAFGDVDDVHVPDRAIAQCLVTMRARDAARAARAATRQTAMRRLGEQSAVGDGARDPNGPNPKARGPARELGPLSADGRRPRQTRRETQERGDVRRGHDVGRVERGIVNPTARRSYPSSSRKRKRRYPRLPGHGVERARYPPRPLMAAGRPKKPDAPTGSATRRRRRGDTLRVATEGSITAHARRPRRRGAPRGALPAAARTAIGKLAEREDAKAAPETAGPTGSAEGRRKKPRWWPAGAARGRTP